MDQHISQAGGLPVLRPPHVLVVDDNADIREMLTNIFEYDGFVVTSAVDGASALTCLDNHLEPDLILIDARMPVLDGFATCERIRARPEGADIPLLMITAHDDASSVERAFASGANDVLFKPLHLSLLRARARNMVQARQDAIARQASEANFRSAFEYAAIGMALIGLDGRILQVNSAFCEMFGYTAAELVGRFVDRDGILHPHPDDYLVGEIEAQMSVQGKLEHYQFEKRYRRKDGSLVYCEVSRALVRDRQGAPHYFISQIQDITANKQAEADLEHYNKQLTSMLESTTDAFYAVDHAWCFTYLNHRAELLLHHTREELIGQYLWDMFSEAVDTEFYTQFHDAVARQQPVTVEAWYEPFATWFEVHAYPTQDGLAVFFRDISERRQAVDALQASEEYLRALVENSAEIITVLDADGTMRYTSPAQRRLLGYDDTESAAMFDFVHPEDVSLVANLFDHFSDGQPMVTAEFRVRHRDGTWRVFEATGTNLLDNPAVRGIVVNSHDISERKRAEEQLAYDAFHDALTGLANRLLFMDRLSQALDRSTRGHERCAVFFLDLDRFKMVNDSLGHEIGDQLLINVARRLESCVRLGDTVARLGGDEFAILLEDEDIQASHLTSDVANRITRAFDQSFLVHGQEIVTSACIGIALSAPERMRPDELLRDADIAMYSAKRRGPGNHAVADPTMHAGIMARVQRESDLRHALDRHEFMLYYQPTMAIDGRTMLGVEALLRWQHPEHGFISPLDFIPLAEETGLIVPIGEWVLRTACAQLQAWIASGLAPLVVAVNLSARQFKQPGLALRIRDILLMTGLDPQYLSLELTESLLMEDAEATIATLHELRSVGIGALAIDDFGTGYSSLSYLQRFPVTELKIDRSFVREVMTSANDAKIANAIIALAHSLGLSVTAEGIETEEQRIFLECGGCDRFQGYLVSRPLPAEQIFDFVGVMSR